MRELVYTPAARSDLDAIFDFMVADNPRRALTWVEEIQVACEGLRRMPLMGIERPDLRSGLRVLPFRRRIVIAYELPPGRVDVLRIFAAGRDYEAIMAENQESD